MQARLRPHQVDARAIEPGFEGVGPDAVEHGHGRHVQRIDQGFLDRNLAVEDAVEILGLVVAKARRRVHQPGVGRDDAVFEADAVDEGFQARSGRAQGARHVDPAACPVEPA